MPLTILRLPWPLFVASVLFWLLSSEASAEPRVKIVLFKYLGALEGHANVKFDAFRGILKQKLLNLKKEVSQASVDEQVEGLDLGYLDKVYIRFRDKDTFRNLEDIDKWMKSQPTVLSLLRGSIISDDNTTYTVYSHFYLGELKEHYPRDVITVRLPVKGTEFANTKDSHTLVILYALAMDAKRVGYGKNHIALFLKAAKDKIADIKRRAGNLSGDLAGLEGAISQATTELLGDPR